MAIRNLMVRAMLRAIAILAAPLPENRRFSLLASTGQALVPRYRFKWPHMEWWHDEHFNEYLARFRESEGFNTDRRLMIHELIRLVAGIPGDTAECGAFQGAGSYLICAANTAHGHRTHHIFDSFEGMSAPTDADGDYWTPGSMAFGMSGVQRNLNEFADVRYYQGWIPARFAEVADREFAFVHIDVDLAEPTRDSMTFFYPRMSAGGIIVCDDYAFTTCPGATQVIDEFLADKPEKMIRMSGGGGFLIKGCVTGEPPLEAQKRSRTQGVVAGRA